MKAALLLFPLLTACAHPNARPAEFSLPPSSPTREELLQALPANLFRGDISVTSRKNDATEYLTFVFLKDLPEDQVPMRVALYRNFRGQPLALALVAQTPFTAGECRRGECRARISEMPAGFQIGRESFGADHGRADYRFARSGNDLALLGKGFQVRSGRGDSCSVYYDYEKRRILRRQGKKTWSEKMPDGPPPRLIADQLRFDTASPAILCALPATQ